MRNVGGFQIRLAEDNSIIRPTQSNLQDRKLRLSERLTVDRVTIQKTKKQKKICNVNDIHHQRTVVAIIASQFMLTIHLPGTKPFLNSRLLALLETFG
jgi:hypothetical protein